MVQKLPKWTDKLDSVKSVAITLYQAWVDVKKDEVAKDGNEFSSPALLVVVSDKNDFQTVGIMLLINNEEKEKVIKWLSIDSDELLNVGKRVCQKLKVKLRKFDEWDGKIHK